MKIFWSALFSLLWLGCDLTSSKPPIAEENAKLGQLELEFNHLILTRMHLYFTEVEPLSSYRGHGNPIDGAYADVSYMYSSLTDRFTRYFPPDQATEILSMYLGSDDQMALIGVMLATLEDTLVVDKVVPGSPAELSGIQEGDHIVEVDSINVTGPNISKYETLTAGGAGTAFKLTVLRNGVLLEFSVAKKVIVVPTVWLDQVDSIPVIQVDFFAASEDGKNNGTASEFTDALARAGAFTVAIIDLRGNPGGSVDECTAMTDALLDTGVIVYSIDRVWDEKLHISYFDSTDILPVTANSPYENRRYVFLQDKGSASCSEIMLAGVKRNTDWPIVGEQSYGKGIAQQLIYPTYAKGLAVVTTTEFRDGDWNNYHHIGIVPDYAVTDPDSALAMAVTLAKGTDSPVALARSSAQVIMNQESIARINFRLTHRPARPNGAWIRK
jgi:C-terminal peptidase prc